MSIEDLLIDCTNKIEKLQDYVETLSTEITSLREELEVFRKDRIDEQETITCSYSDIDVLPEDWEKVILEKKILQFSDVKARVNEMAMNHRDAIKALNVKYGLKMLKDMLIDENDVNGGVKDQAALESYYEDLKNLEKGE